MKRHEGLPAPASQSKAGDPADSPLRLIGTICGGGSCPAVFRTDRGTLIVQGTAVDAGDAGITLSAGESLVEIPEELLTLFAARRTREADPAA